MKLIFNVQFDMYKNLLGLVSKSFFVLSDAEKNKTWIEFFRILFEITQISYIYIKHRDRV